MGRALYASEPVFAAAFDAVCGVLDGFLPLRLASVVFAEGDAPEAALLGQTQYTQAALFAVGTALFRLVESRGLRPDFLLGHSIGELTAAHVSGVLGLGDAGRLVAVRGRLMQAARDDGAMAVIEASEAEVLSTLVGGVVIAGLNSPSATEKSISCNATMAFAPPP